MVFVNGITMVLQDLIHIKRPWILEASGRLLPGLMDNPGRRGRGGRARPTGRRKQLPSEQPASPIDPTQKNPIQSLVRTAITPSSNSVHFSPHACYLNTYCSLRGI